MAFAILSLVLVALYGQVIQTSRLQQTGQAKSAAIILDQSKLELVDILLPLQVGVREGQSEDGFSWRLTITDYQTSSSAAVSSAYPLYLARVEVFQKGRQVTTLQKLLMGRLQR